jgi:2,5-diamino-6-(ribosylamino)-4(3H)-pyrimidinone 5'-phosphate reductase
LRSAPGATPAHAGDEPVRELVTGVERVDLAAALAALADREDAKVVRVDSGGALAGALLRGGLVDELSLLVHPCVTGAAGDRAWYGPAPAPALTLERLASERFDDGPVWLRYRIVGPAERGGRG